MKWKMALLCALCVGLLSGCSSEKTIDGQVLYANPAEEALHLWVETEEKEMIGIFVEEDALVFSFIEDADIEAFWAGELENVQIRANCVKKPPVKLEDGKEIIQYAAKQIGITDAAERSALERDFDPRFISFYRDNLQIAFPKEEEGEYSIIVGMDYEELTGILHDWAIPVKE